MDAQDKTTFEESQKVIIDMPVCFLVSENESVKRMAHNFFVGLVDCAVAQIRDETIKAGLTDDFQLQVNDLGEVEETMRVRRIVVQPQRKPIQPKVFKLKEG